MTRRLLFVAALLVVAAARLAPPQSGTLPDTLSDEQFWKLSTDLSETGGTFRSDNLLSNERFMQHVIPELLRDVVSGGAYIGVGPEQNFTYIGALRPGIAFIVDIRRGNLHLHLMYKALFELSADRVEFVSRLFSRRAPPTITSAVSVADLFKAFVETESDAGLFAANVAAIRKTLTGVRKLPLSPDDLQAIEAIYQTFYTQGPLIQYSASFGGGVGFPTYADLMAATDAAGVTRGFLASDEAFTFVKRMQSKNLIVPIVGDFAGPKALRGVAEYLKERRATVGAFYLSNVEQYLGREGRWGLFCENVRVMPLDSASYFIRSVRDGSYGRGAGLASVTGNILSETRICPK